MRFLPAEETAARVVPEVPGFKLLYTHHYVFTQELSLAPVDDLMGVYKTAERRRGRLYDAEYETEIVSITITHHWDEKKQAWWGSGGARMRIIDPRTHKPYQSGWRADLVRYSPHGHPSQADVDTDALIAKLVEMTKPTTKITVIEEPA